MINSDEPAFPWSDEWREAGLTKREHAIIEIYARLVCSPDHVSKNFHDLSNIAIHAADTLFKNINQHDG